MQSFSATIFGSEFSEHQKGPFNWEGKTAAFWEFTTMVGIINLTTNIIPWQRQWCKFISVQKDRHITPYSTWISVGFINFRYPPPTKKDQNIFFPDLKSKCHFFLETAKNLPSKASSSETENRGSKKVEGRSPFLPSERRGSQEGRRHGSRAEKLRCFTDGFPGPSEQCFRLISHWCWSLDSFFVKRCSWWMGDFF